MTKEAFFAKRMLLMPLYNNQKVIPQPTVASNSIMECNPDAILAAQVRSKSNQGLYRPAKNPLAGKHFELRKVDYAQIAEQRAQQ